MCGTLQLLGGSWHGICQCQEGDRRRLSAGAAFTMCTCCELDDLRGVFVLSKMGGGLGLAGPKYRQYRMVMLCVCRASRALCSPIIHYRLHDDTHRRNLPVHHMGTPKTRQYRDAVTSEPITRQIDVLLAPAESGLDPPSNRKMPFIKPFY